MKERYSIRLAEPRDDQKVGELLIQAFLETYRRKIPDVVYSEERLRELRDIETRRQQGRVWVSEWEGQLVGTITLIRPNAPLSESWTPQTADLRMLALDPQFHGKGLADPLVHIALQEAEAWRCTHVSLHVRRGATGVERFYERFGWKRTPEGDLDLLPLVFLHGYLKKIEPSFSPHQND